MYQERCHAVNDYRQLFNRVTFLPFLWLRMSRFPDNSDKQVTVTTSSRQRDHSTSPATFLPDYLPLLLLLFRFWRGEGAKTAVLPFVCCSDPLPSGVRLPEISNVAKSDSSNPMVFYVRSVQSYYSRDGRSFPVCRTMPTREGERGGICDEQSRESEDKMLPAILTNYCNVQEYQLDVFVTPRAFFSGRSNQGRVLPS
ncbi:hypothetical protein J6590_039424 [Homalodisca vitripennis]|nr:hypothetical protein J6590_039424 [Homalodisca vitripennis]